MTSDLKPNVKIKRRDLDYDNYCKLKIKVPRGKRVWTHEPYYEDDDGFEYDGPSWNVDMAEYKPLYLVVEPSEFKIDPEKGTTFSITSLSKNPQDVIVTVHSYMFEIKDARRKLGITSQWFHVMNKDEKKSFEIVMKDLEDESMGNFKSSPYDIATGHIEITHYKSRIAGSFARPKVTDSDEEWNIEKSKLLLRTACNDQHYCGYWREALEVQFETESFKKRKYRFMEIRHDAHVKKRLASIKSSLPKSITATQEYLTGSELWEVDPKEPKFDDKHFYYDPEKVAVYNAWCEQKAWIELEKKPKPPVKPSPVKPPEKKWKLKNIFKKKEKK